MICIERHVQKIVVGKWAELAALDQKYEIAESRLGFPQKRRYRCYLGGHDTNTLIIERQWQSLASMEAIYEKAFADPEYQALEAAAASIIASVQIELYAPMP